MTMECNKEEAIRAKDLAENKMRGRDFVGARKIVIKAQQLFPDLENISQMLTVCEVHCSAEIKVNGETDWYAILQVELTADEVTIKRQYRKLALLLHPDKNKFAGAEAAFKLVGEAHRTLSDQAKRSLHDMKRRTNFKTVSLRQPTQQPNRSSFPRKQPGVSNNATNRSSTSFNGPNQQQPSQSSNAQTFWTICPFCGIRYQYYQSILNRALRCQNCMKPFIAYDLNTQAVPSGANTGYPWNRTGIPPQDIRAPGVHVAGQKNNIGNAGSNMGFQGNVGGGSTSSQPWSTFGFSAEVGDGSKNKASEDCKTDHEVPTANEVKFEKVRLPGENKREKAVKPSGGNSRQKRGRKLVIESSDSESSDSDVVVEDGHRAGQNFGTTGSNPRRSTRQKQNISYNEDGDDDDFDSVRRSGKRLRKDGAACNGDQNDKAYFEGFSNGVDKLSSGLENKEIKSERVDGSPLNGSHEREHGPGNREENLNNASSSKANPHVGSSEKTMEDVDSITYPDPEFFDFEKERDTSKFEVSQIWAVYDDLDGMPRFYVRITSVHVPGFLVRFTWLENKPVGQLELKWFEEDLPVACGKFGLGKTQTSKEKLMFSHLMSYRRGNKRNSYEIYPSEGEVWALFKEWDIGWSTDADNHRSYEYEVVEVLSDFTESTGLTVVNLVKINGFVSLFMPAVGEGPRVIPASEILRFSHKVPSYRMTGEERDGIPPGSLELDATSLPSNFAECFPSVSPESIMTSGREKPTVAATKTDSSQLNENAHEKQKSSVSSPNGLDGACKKEHIQASKEHHSASEAGKHVETERGESSADTTTEQHNASPFTYEYPDAEFYNFHESRSEDKYECGQIWALYSDITSYPNYYGRIREVKVEPGEFELQVQWLEGCTVRKEDKRWLKELPVSCGTFKIPNNNMDIHDAIDAFSHLVHAVPAEKKDHYAIYPNTGEVWALYKNWNIKWSRSDLEDCEYDVVEILGRSDSGIKGLVLTKTGGYRSVFMPGKQTIEIPVADYLRFSHQIPAFRLTEERGGKLRGNWELDPASVPQILLIVDSD